jgi:putative ABC transport system permease protein
MSGGQMQRVAIARALINNPDILLADEPTGALDSETSLQIMELLKEIAAEKLVIMVTHNPELAESYSTRIVKLLDGKVVSDTDPWEPEEQPQQARTRKKISMSFFTALSLSFNNLRTKLGRTLLTAFAGSIGIIGIALILSLSTGIQNYINGIQRDTLTSYPITIQRTESSLGGMLTAQQEYWEEESISSGKRTPSIPTTRWPPCSTPPLPARM